MSTHPPTNDSAHHAITVTLAQYLAGCAAGKSALMQPAFHAQARFCGQVGAKTIVAPIQALFDATDRGGPSPDMRAQIGAIDIAGSAATARVEIEGLNGHRYTDLFTLLKIGEEWKLMCKTFHQGT